MFLKAAWNDSRSENIDNYNGVAKAWDLTERRAFASRFGTNVTLGYEQMAMNTPYVDSTLSLLLRNDVIPLRDSMKKVYAYSTNAYYKVRGRPPTPRRRRGARGGASR